MPSFNKVILAGHLTRDVEVKFTPRGTATAEMGLAVNRKWFDKASNAQKEEVTFVDVTLWGKDAENAGEYLTKGKAVLVEGRLQLDTWDDKQSGQKRSKLKVVCEHLQFLGSSQSSNSSAPRRDHQSGQGQDSRREPAAPIPDEVPF